MQRQDVPDDAKLYVSNLPSSMTNDLLRSVFTPFGEVCPGQLILRDHGVQVKCRVFRNSSCIVR
jgi:RNA recognition motif-containing protein